MLRKSLKLNMMTVCLITLLLGACATTTVPKPKPPQNLLPGTQSVLQQGKRLFEQHHYKQAMHDLLPLACDCIAEAEYAVGYMYYYGYGVAQDTEVGTFWIRRSAQHGYEPAKDALQIISTDKYHNTKNKLWPRGI